MGIKTVPHPCYSPDFALCDFWLFPKLRGCNYETIEEMKEALTKRLLWRYNECIAAVGVYFEGDKSFMCVLSIKVPIQKKKSLETYRMHLVSLAAPPNTIWEAVFLVWNSWDVRRVVCINTRISVIYLGLHSELFLVHKHKSFSLTMMLLGSDHFSLSCYKVTVSSIIVSYAKVPVDSSRHLAFLFKSCRGWRWVGFNRAFEASKKPRSALRIIPSLVFFSINLGLLFKSFKNTIICCFRKFRQH